MTTAVQARTAGPGDEGCGKAPVAAGQEDRSFGREQGLLWHKLASPTHPAGVHRPAYTYIKTMSKLCDISDADPIGRALIAEAAAVSLKARAQQ